MKKEQEAANQPKAPSEPQDAAFSMAAGQDYRQAWRIFRIMSELVEGYQLMSEFHNEVTIFGSARTKHDNTYYDLAENLGYALSKRGNEVITGGGPGIMEAANKGAHRAGGVSIGLNIQLPFEQRVNQYVNKALGFYYFFTRKVILTSPATAFIFFPGGFGTMDEFFEVVDHIELGMICEVPIVLVGSDFWNPLIDFLRVSGEACGTITEEQIQKWHIVDSVEDAIEIIKHGKEMKRSCPLSAMNFSGDKNVDWRVFRVMSELVEGYEFLTGLGEDVSVLGTKSLKSDSPYYKSAYILGGLLADAGYATITGGAPGIAEAANKGAFEKGGESIGLGMTVHGKERMNDYVSRSLMFTFPYTRKLILTAPSKTFVFYPGGLGTLHQLFEVLTLIQTGKIRKVPVVLYGQNFWGPLDEWIRTSLAERFKTISPGDTDLYTVVNSEKEIMQIVASSDAVTTILENEGQL